MEHLFSPCNRLRDLVESRAHLEDYSDLDDIDSLQELDLDVSTEEFRSVKDATYADLYAMLEKHRYGLVVDTYALIREVGLRHSVGLEDDYIFRCGTDGETIWLVLRGRLDLRCCFRLLAASAVHSVVHTKSDASSIPAWRI
jgi:hypothetical protein